MVPDDLESAKKTFISEVLETIVLNDIPGELIFNWGLTWFLVHCGPWTKGGKNELTFQDLRIKDKLLPSCGKFMGEVLPPQLIYGGKSDRCHPPFDFDKL